MYKEKLEKIGKNEYELPKEGNMQVPGKIFISEKMNIEEDALKQVANVAHLPGILKYSIGLADMHVGYGFPIGGVAAFDLDKGVISPGGVGYDINCLEENSRVLSEFGYYKKIKDFEEDDKNNLIILDKDKKKAISSNILLFMKKDSKKITKIKTKSGAEILATKEHPFYTKEGMKNAEEIKIGEELLVYPFEGIEYEKPDSTLLVNEEDIDKMNLSFTSKLQIKSKLKSLGLLPLYSDNIKIPYLIKIIGFVLGDGYLGIGKNNQVQFYGKVEDLEFIKEDLRKIGFLSHSYSRIRKHKMKTQYKGYEFERKEDSLHSSSSSLAVLLNLLGVPSGNKAEKDYDIPEWIMKSPKWYKRLFLASLFGAEMSSPRTITNHKFNLYCPIFSLSKRDSSHGLRFINQMSILLEEFEIKNALVKLRVDEVNGTKANRIRLMVNNDSENLINLFSKINYEYNIKKRKLANAAILWLKSKERVLDFREEVMEKAREMKKNGFSKSQIISSLSSKYSNRHFINKALYYQDYGRTGSRIAYCFISFNDFLEANCYGDSGFIWEEVDYKEEKEHNNLVYDIGVNNENHNFIANGFVVSNCSIRLLKTSLKKEDVLKKQKEIMEILYKKIPSGVGRGSGFNMNKQELIRILEGGAEYIVEQLKLGVKEDYLHTEEEGRMKEARADAVSDRAMKRGIGQLGTLGAGNHFLEMQYVDEIFDEKIAKEFGIKKGQVTIMVHCGSRGLGHQIASDYIQLMEKEYGFENLPDRELVNAPIKSKLGKDYYSAMSAAANFAFANKQLITHWIREEMLKVFPNVKIDVVYDVCHNIAKFEEHIIDGKKKMVCVHRKGATRAFGPGRKEIPEAYRKIGQPVIIPGSMGTASYLLIGTKKAEELTFGSTVHGAGRLSSRSSALRNLNGEEIMKGLNKKGIEVKAGSMKSLAEEAPEAYKDIDEVVKVVDELGISRKIARMKPLVVVKG